METSQKPAQCFNPETATSNQQRPCGQRFCLVSLSHMEPPHNCHAMNDGVQ